jgi:hypothetical protein
VRLGGLDVDDQLKLRGLLDRQFRGLRAERGDMLERRRSLTLSDNKFINFG